MKRNLLGLCQCVVLVFACEAQGSLGEEIKDKEERPPSLKFLAAASALKIPEKDVSEFYGILKGVKPGNFSPIVQALAPLVQDLEVGGTDSFYIYFVTTMVQDLGALAPKDAPKYVGVFMTLVQEPKNAEGTQKLLSIFLEQGSIADAKELVRDAGELTSLFKTEGDLKYIFEYLVPLSSEKRAAVVKAVAPLVKGFEENYHNIQYTLWMLQNLGKVASEDAPKYVRVLRTVALQPKNAYATEKLLSIFLQQGSVAAAERLVGDAGELRAFFTREGEFQHIFEYLADVLSEKRAVVADATVLLAHDFEENARNVQYIGLIIRDLGALDSADIPGYMTIFTTLVPQPKDANATQKLLSLFLEQGSVAAAERLVEDAGEIKSLFETEQDFQYIFKHLASLSSEKRAAVVGVIVPLAHDFEENARNTQYIGLIIRDLGALDSADISRYIKALENADFNRKSAQATQEALKKILPQTHGMF